MKEINLRMGKIFLLFLALATCLNLLARKVQREEIDQSYKVSVNRIAHAVQLYEEEHGKPAGTLTALAECAGVPEFAGIVAFTWTCSESSGEFQDMQPERKESQKAEKKQEIQNLEKQEGFIQWEEFWKNDGQQYQIIATDQYFYKVLYDLDNPSENLLFWVNITSLAFLFGILGLFWYFGKNLLRPVHQFSQLPYQLSKGILTLPLKENKNRFLGKFLWGMDMLREHLEEQKQRELELQKEKKLLLLSLSHDIKTPLSAIKLYARALARNLYQEETKKRKIAENINQKADEIEHYISEIVRTSHEEFLDFQVENQEFYIGDVLEKIRAYYQEKMALNQILFQIGDYSNCLVYGDPDRLLETLQNIVENAIKYGDGAQIEFSMIREEEAYLIFIKNSGCSLPLRELPHIFDSFFRGSNVAKQPGSGLGLYICRQLMHQMEGEITASVESEGIMTVLVAVRLL